ncbi:MAG TPA: hypothetical protein VHZ24_11685 [Pirellulales bacterium]|jgi:hypothetical protein|nr:hypothetical protein [Pirellulales bacterium]
MVVHYAPADMLEELEQRQDEVLEQLDELNLRVERALAEHGKILATGAHAKR